MQGSYYTILYILSLLRLWLKMFSLGQVIVEKPLEMICNCHGSYVLRTLLSLCKGVSVETTELRGAKSSKALAKRLNLKTSHSDENNLEFSHQGFPDVFSYLLSGILSCSREYMKYLQVDQCSSLVLQVYVISLSTLLFVCKQFI